MRTSAASLLLLVVSLGYACSQPGSTPVAPAATSGSLAAQGGGGALSATIRFGLDEIGSPFPPPSGHDQSNHARDNLVPRTVVIDRGGTVTFEMGVGGVHAVAIYNPGKDAADVNTAVLSPPAVGCPPAPLINDPVDRLAVVGTQVCAGGSPAPTYTFTEPGKYLVICRFLPHFNIGMYGWVVVRK
jgi:plastocyanin